MTGYGAKFSLGLTTCILLTGCETVLPILSKPQAARLAVDPDESLREQIRVHVNDTLGPDYFVDPIQLKGDGRLIAKDRGRAEAMGEVKLMPPAHFRLELDGNKDAPICRLVRDDPDTDTPDLILSDASVCVPVGKIN